MCCQYGIPKKLTAAQPLKIDLEFDGVVPAEVNDYRIVSSKLTSISSDGR